MTENGWISKLIMGVPGNSETNLVPMYPRLYLHTLGDGQRILWHWLVRVPPSERGKFSFQYVIKWIDVRKINCNVIVRCFGGIICECDRFFAHAARRISEKRIILKQRLWLWKVKIKSKMKSKSNFKDNLLQSEKYRVVFKSFHIISQIEKHTITQISMRRNA